MSETISVELTPEQREMLLRGLRFVASASRLECRVPTTESEAERKAELAEVEGLVARLHQAPAHGRPASV